MTAPQPECPYRLAHEEQYRHLAGNLAELRERVCRLEVTLTRGIMLLIANLAGVAISLAEQLLRP